MAFDVTKKHPLYEKRIKQWIRQRDVIEGEDRIKECGETYLPRLSGQMGQRLQQYIGADEDNLVIPYEDYKTRASFLNATCRTRDGLTGAVMRKEPQLSWPKEQLELLDSAGSSLESFGELQQEALDETVGIGRYGQLVDAPIVEGGDPYVSTYFAEAITNWDEERINGRKRNTLVVLVEDPIEVETSSGTEYRRRYRVLRLGQPIPETDDELKVFKDSGYAGFLAMHGLPIDLFSSPIYFQEIYDEVYKEAPQGTKNHFIRTAIIVPRIKGGSELDEIPWTFFNPQSTRPSPEKPLLLDMAVINISHYRNSADLEHGLHFTALPQPWAAGFKSPGVMTIGSSVAWMTENHEAKAGYLEFSGQGLAALREQMDRKKKEMASLGARLIEEQQPAAGGTEAAETVKLRQSGEMSVLSRVTINISKALSRTLRFLAMFHGLPNPKEVGVVLNMDFGVYGMEPDMLNALLLQVQAGAMSWNTYFWNVKRGELTPDNLTMEEEARMIEAGPPGGLALTFKEEEPVEETEPEMEEAVS